MVTFTAWEWTRLICYICAMPAAYYLVIRTHKRKDFVATLMWSGIALMFAWFIADLTMASAGISTRETRNFSTPIILLACGGVVLLAVREFRAQRRERMMIQKVDEIERMISNLKAQA